MRRAGVAEAALGKQAEILARGDLARNGLEQVLVVNRLLEASSSRAEAAANSAPIFVTRAAVLEKMDGKWSEVLLCDEHLKNPNGYLGGSPAATRDRLAAGIQQDAKRRVGDEVHAGGKLRARQRERGSKIPSQ